MASVWGSIWFFAGLAFLGGIAVTVQVGVNVQVAGAVGNPIWAAWLSFTVGSLALLAYYLVLRQPWPGLAAVTRMPVWMWAAGFLGAFYVSATVVSAPRLGAALLIGIIVGGQMLTSLLLDHFGALGFPQQPLSGWRIVGALFLVVGVVLIRRF